MKYTIKQFRKDFPTDERCLKYLLKTRFPEAKGFHLEKGRTRFTHQKGGKHISPMAGTIFQDSATPIGLWFYAIYLFSVSKNGVSAKELERQLGVSYPTALRMGRQIRSLMTDNSGKLTGTVEIDETFVTKNPVVGAVERGGRVRAKVVEKANGAAITTHAVRNIADGAKIMSDSNPSYLWLDRHYERESVNHSKEYVNGQVHISSMEGFWSQVKRGINGTHHWVSPKHLQGYVDFFSFQHSHRASEVPLFSVLLQRACVLRGATA